MTVALWARAHLGRPPRPPHPHVLTRIPPPHARSIKNPDFKKAYVYLDDGMGAKRPRYHELEAALTDEAMAAWPAKPGEDASGLAARRRERDAERAGGSSDDPSM